MARQRRLAITLLVHRDGDEPHGAIGMDVVGGVQDLYGRQGMQLPQQLEPYGFGTAALALPLGSPVRRCCASTTAPAYKKTEHASSSLRTYSRAVSTRNEVC